MNDKSASEGLGTVQRVIEILRHVAERGETTIKDVSAALGLSPSTCHRMLDLMVKEDLVERNAAQRSYRIGPGLYRLSALIQAHYDIRELARPLLQHIVDVCDETCVLGLYMPAEGEMIFAEKADSSQILRYQLPMNSPLSVFWGASGKSILAFLPKADIDRIYAAATAAPASGAKRPSRQALDQELLAIRRRGFAASKGEKIAGAVGISAPVFRAGGQVLGSLGLTVPQQRATAQDETRFGVLIVDQAKALSRLLGASDQDINRHRDDLA
ncbi:MAG TPA: IclR family transcriptional regulator [Beijerinckiaceae bacterium]|jgi:DNA-binding IclR family transcriptional regulator|nr:IclR family transcriptional regulator [Beijerinckiaceae bacterium]